MATLMGPSPDLADHPNFRVSASLSPERDTARNGARPRTICGRHITTMKSFLKSCAALAAVCLTATALAADPSGTWKFNGQGESGPAENTVVLALVDGKLGGTVTGPRRGGRESSVKLASASVKGDVVNFTVQRTVRKEKVVAKYSGRIEGDTITGTVESPAGPDGKPATGEWMARRAQP